MKMIFKISVFNAVRSKDADRFRQRGRYRFKGSCWYFEIRDNL
jgi:hypothetical protein